MLQGLEEQHDLEAVAVDAGEVGARRGPAWTRLRASSIRRRRWWRLDPLGPVDACTNQFRTISRTTIARKPVIASRPRAERRGGRERGEDDEPRRDRRGEGGPGAGDDGPAACAIGAEEARGHRRERGPPRALRGRR